MLNFKRYSYFLSACLFLVVNAKCQTQEAKSADLKESQAEFIKLEKVFSFPNKIQESSGIIYYGNAIWTHNDSGDEPNLYKLNPSNGKLDRTVHIKSIQHYDWEDIMQDKEHVYVGDMGNNRGNRKDLKIYKITKASLEDELPEETVDSISFSYPEQKSFIDGAYQHNFDCEAISSWGEEILLFTKNHQNRSCNLYSLKKEAGEQAAVLLHEFDTKGLITGSAIDKKKNLIACIGYERLKNQRVFQPFIYLIKKWKGKTKKVETEKIYLDMDAQTEGICSLGDGIFYISSEKSGSGKGAVFYFDANLYLK